MGVSSTGEVPESIGYLVNIPLYFKGTDKESIDKVVHTISSILQKNPLFHQGKNLKVVFGLNQKKGSADQAIIREGLAKVEDLIKRLKDEGVISFDVCVENCDWEPMEEETIEHPINYTAIRNNLFHLPSNRILFDRFIAENARDIIYMTMDPDVELGLSQFNQVEEEMVKPELVDSPLVVAGHYRFKVEHPELVIGKDDSLNWTSFLVDVFTNYDQALKQQLSEVTFTVRGPSGMEEVPGTYILYPPEPALFFSLYKKRDDVEVDLFKELREKTIEPWGHYAHTDEGETLVATMSRVWKDFAAKLPTPFQKRKLIALSFHYETEVPARVIKSLMSREAEAMSGKTESLFPLPLTREELSAIYKTEAGKKQLVESLTDRFSMIAQSSLRENFVKQRKRYILGIGKTEKAKPSPLDPEIREQVFEAFLAVYMQRSSILIGALIWETLNQIEKVFET